jgi:D-lactate dehydrogenase
MKIGKPVIAVFDTKPYDRDYLSRATGSDELDWHFHDFRLEAETALTAKGAQAVCVFVNDAVDREVIERLAGWDHTIIRTKTYAKPHF